MLEQSAGGGEAIQIRRSYEAIAMAAEGIKALLIAAYLEDVGPCHLVCPSRSEDSARADPCYGKAACAATHQRTDIAGQMG